MSRKPKSTKGEHSNVNKRTTDIMNAKMDRRTALSNAGKVAIGVGAVAVVGGIGAYLATQGGAPSAKTVTVTGQASTVTATAPATSTTPVSGATPMVYFIWGWGTEWVKDNEETRFDQKVPKISVRVEDVPCCAAYRESLIARLTTNTPTDLFYNDDAFSSELQASGLLVPMEDYHPEIKDYQQDVFPGLIPQLTMVKGGKWHSLAYYADYIGFMYNQKILQQAQIDEPPKSWDDLRAQALKIKQKGILKFPIMFVIGCWQFWEQLYATTYAQPSSTPNSIFDKNLDPVFGSETSALGNALQFYLDLINKDKTMSPEAVTMTESGGNEGFAAGTWAFLSTARYDLPLLQDPSFSKVAGNVKEIPWPSIDGKESPALNWVRPLSMSYLVPKRGQTAIDAAWQVMSYSGGKTNENFEPDFKNGKYRTNTRYAIEKGLGNPWRPTYDDPDLVAAWSKWGDVKLIKSRMEGSKAKDSLTATWWGKWSGLYGPGPGRSVVEAILLGNRSLADGLKTIESLAVDLKREAGAA